MKTCSACSMPLVKKEDFAQGDENAHFCRYCVNENGEVKSCHEIFEGGVMFFVNQTGADRKTAEKLVRKNMNQLPYWKDKNCDILKGETATDDEFAQAMKKLG